MGPDLETVENYCFYTRLDLGDASACLQSVFLIADLLAVTEVSAPPPSLSFLFLTLRQHRCCQCCVSATSVTFPASSLARCSVSSDSAPAPLECFHSGLMGGLCQSWQCTGGPDPPCRLPPGFTYCSWSPGAPRINFPRPSFVLCSDLLPVRCVLCWPSVITFRFLSFFLFFFLQAASVGATRCR